MEHDLDLELHKLPFGDFYYKLITMQELDKCMKTMGIKKRFDEVEPGAATTHVFDNDEVGYGLCLVVLGDMSELSDLDVCTALVHEAVHVKQEYMVHLSEDNPSDEFEAYVVDEIFEALMGDYIDWQLSKPKSSQGELASNPVERISQWFSVAYPNPTMKNACVQIGVHYEEIEEMMSALCDSSTRLNTMSVFYKSLDSDYLAGLGHVRNDNDRSVELLDSFCDQIVTAIGSAQFLGFDIVGALNEVVESNWSKFEDGKAIYDESGKIAKGKDYRKPNLLPFIHRID